MRLLEIEIIRVRYIWIRIQASISSGNISSMEMPFYLISMQSIIRKFYFNIIRGLTNEK